MHAWSSLKYNSKRLLKLLFLTSAKLKMDSFVVFLTLVYFIQSFKETLNFASVGFLSILNANYTN